MNYWQSKLQLFALVSLYKDLDLENGNMTSWFWIQIINQEGFNFFGHGHSYHVEFQVYQDWMLDLCFINMINVNNTSRQAVDLLISCLVSTLHLLLVIDKTILHYSSLPNKRTCTPNLILTKLPPCTLLFGTASLSIFLNF